MPKGIKIPQELREEALNMIREGVPPMTVSQETGISIPALYKYMADAGLVNRNVQNKALDEIPDDIQAEALRLYYNGLAVPDILSLTTLNTSQLVLILKEAGINKVDTTENKAMEKKARQDLVEIMYRSGRPLHEIRASTRFGVPEVYAVLHERGIPLRRPVVVGEVPVGGEGVADREGQGRTGQETE